MKLDSSSLIRLPVATVVVLLSLSWVQVRQHVVDGVANGARFRREIVEYGLPFGWIIHDTDVGWTISVSRLAISVLTILAILILIRYVRDRLEDPRSKLRLLSFHRS